MSKLTRERFLKDVATHVVEILFLQGQHRHLRVRRPGTYCMGFDVVTWPGYLCISGDMGCYVFARLPDMFEFFRIPAERELDINLGYWEEKAQAIGRHDPCRQYSPQRFVDTITRILDDAVESGDCSLELRGEALADLKRLSDNEYEARSAIDRWNSSHRGFQFQEMFEYSFQEYTHRFQWCCWAIVWAIREYDRITAPVDNSDLRQLLKAATKAK